MDDQSYELCTKLVSKSYIHQGQQAKLVHQKKIKHLLQHRKIPSDGWTDQTIELLLQELSLMDSNNFPDNCGVGEREARIFSTLVASRHFRFGHGIGRSGEITAIQPKAAGSSVMMKLTNSLALDIIRISGIQSTAACFVVPIATGMSLSLCMLTFKQSRPNAKFVIWPRIDQKSCIKSMITSGFQPVVVENILEGDELRTNVAGISQKILELGADNILCVMTTTSCFAPRVPDRLEEVSEICKQFDIPHLINNAYGLQCTKCTHLIQQASRKGRVDVFVQSTDKNLMVPVGGSIIAGFDSKLIENISKAYPGRASSTPTMDVFITLLSMGSDKYKELLKERKENYQYLSSKLSVVAAKHGERLLKTPHNGISMGISLPSLTTDSSITEIGSMLFTRFVSGTRVVSNSATESTISGLKLTNFGAHCDSYNTPYLTAAASIGMTKTDVDIFVTRLDKVLNKFKSSVESGNNTVPDTRQTSEQPLSDIPENTTATPGDTMAPSPDTIQTSEQPSSDIPGNSTVKPGGTMAPSPDS